jgi:phage tail-like protein
MNQKSSADFTILTINSEAKWQAQRIAVPATVDNLAIRHEGLALPSFFEYAFDRVIGKPAGLIEPTDLAIDRCGLLFILDGRQGRIATYDRQQDRLEWIECIGGVGDRPTQFQAPKAIAVTDRTLYVADTGNRRVIAFARLNWQVRWIFAATATLGSPPEVFASPPAAALPMAPCDLAVDGEENLYALDSENRLIWKIDPGRRAVGTIGQGRLVDPVTIAIDTTSREDIACALQHIRAGDDPDLRKLAGLLERLRAGQYRRRQVEKILQVLATVYHNMPGADQGKFLSALADLATGTVEERLQALRTQLQQGEHDAIAIVESQLVPLIAKYQTLLYVLDAGLKSVLKFTADDEFLGEAINLQNSDLSLLDPFGLVVDQQTNIYLGDRHTVASGDEDDRFIYKFDASGQPLKPAITAYRGRTDSLVIDQYYNLYILNGERQDITVLRQQEKFHARGIYISKAFDSTVPDCLWHKLVVDSLLQVKTHIRISYYISEAYKPDEDIASLPDSEWSKPLLDPRDALILSPTGRYVWLRIELSGDGQSTPVVHSMQVYFQRTSYLRYLPAVYQEDEASRDFLERFLSLFETFFATVEGEIGRIARVFDPLATPAAFLPWLAQWLAAAVDADWPPEKQRQFLRRAAALYKARGTRRGFEDLIELYTGDKPIIFEFWQLRCIQDAKLRTVYERVFGNEPFHFCVLLKPAQVRTEREYFAVKRLIEADKPAHTAAGVRLLQLWIYLDMHTYLGINTYLQRPEMRLEQQSVIGRDSVLTDMAEAGQVERRSQLNMDTILT